MRTAALASFTALALAFSGGTALAQDSPSARGYDETLGVIGEVDSPSKSAAQPAAQETAPVAEEAPVTPTQPVEQKAGDLPFTGLEVGVVAGMGMLLLGTGFVLRRTTRRGPVA